MSNFALLNIKYSKEIIERKKKMAEKKTTKVAATKKAAATKAPAKKAATKKTVAKESVLYINAENAGFRGGDVYQVLAASEKALSVAEIAKNAKLTEGEVILALGWLLKEGKVASTEDNKVVLA